MQLRARSGDGRGGLLQCGSCNAPEICGGGGQPGVCGPSPDAGGGGCTGLCLQQQTCPVKTVTTTISGTVYAPNGTDPLLQRRCLHPQRRRRVTDVGRAALLGGRALRAVRQRESPARPLVSTLTAPDGTFQLQNVPAGTNIPLVIQLGRWRRPDRHPLASRPAPTRP